MSAATPAIDYVHDLLFMFTDSGVMSVFPRAFPDGALAPGASFDSTAVPGSLAAVDGESDELYFWNADHILVARRPTGAALSLSRSISGSATRLYSTQGLTICN